MKTIDELTVAIAKLQGYYIREGWSERRQCTCWTLYGPHGRVGLPNVYGEPWRNAPRYARSLDALNALCEGSNLTWEKRGDLIIVRNGRRKYEQMIGGVVSYALATAVLRALEATQ